MPSSSCRGGIGTLLEMSLAWQLLQVRKLYNTLLILVGEMWAPSNASAVHRFPVSSSTSALTRPAFTAATSAAWSFPFWSA